MKKIIFILLLIFSNQVIAGGLSASFTGSRYSGMTRTSTVAEYFGITDGSNNLIDMSGENLSDDRTAFDNWTELGTCPVTVDQYRNPVDGAMDADLIDNTGGISNDHLVNPVTPGGGLAGRTFTYSVWIRSDNPHNCSLKMWESGIAQLGATENVWVTSNWNRFSMTRTTAGGGTGDIGLDIFPGQDGVATGRVYAYGAQIIENDEWRTNMGTFLNPTDQSIIKPALDLANTNDPTTAYTDLQSSDGNRLPAREYNGVNQEYSLAHNDCMNINDADHTYTFYINASTGAGGQDVFFQHGVTNSDGIFLMADHGANRWVTRYNSATDHIDVLATSPSGNVDDGYFHFVQLVRNNNIAILYIDGIPGASYDVTGYGIDTNRTLFLGRTTFPGKIAYVRLDSEALSLDELAADRERILGIATNVKQVPKIDVMIDGDSELAGVASWTVGNTAILTKSTVAPHTGTQALRVFKTGSYGYARQTILTVGQTYRLLGYARGDGTSYPRVQDSAGIVWSGATSTAWQNMDAVFVATSTQLDFYKRINGGEWCEFDDIIVLEYDPSIWDFSRSTTAYKQFSAGGANALTPTLVEVPANVPRVAGSGGGVLIEGESTNICTYSEEFDAAGTDWTETRVSVVNDSIITLNGTVTADTIHEDATLASSHYIRQPNITTTNGDTYTFSFYAKEDNRNWVASYITIDATGGYFDLSNCTIATSIGGAVLSTEPLNDGLCRCSATWTSGITGVQGATIYIGEADNDITFDGLDQDSLYLWGTQFEESPFATSYIPTPTNAAVTRTADDLTIDPHPANTNERILPELFAPNTPADKLSVYFEAKCQFNGLADIGTSRFLLEISGNTGTAGSGRNRFRIYASSDGRIYFRINDDSSTQHRAATLVDIVDYDEWFSVRAFFDFSDFSRLDGWVNELNAVMVYSGNSGTGSFDTTNTLIRIGQDYSGSINAQCHIRSLRINNKEILAP